MKQISNFVILVLLFLSILETGCSNSSTSTKKQDATRFSKNQEDLMGKGWYIPKSAPVGELSSKYGVKSIEIGDGCDVAIKIVNQTNDQCIRYVFIPANTTANIQMIPQGQYYLKLAYGKDWMEYDNGDGTIDGKFTSNVSYDKSVDVFDFGKKNSSSVINYVLQINIKESLLQNNFQTVSISESEFRK